MRNGLSRDLFYRPEHGFLGRAGEPRRPGGIMADEEKPLAVRSGIQRSDERIEATG
jgi:hypothetical protein